MVSLFSFSIVSIHTPTQGVTFTFDNENFSFVGFNPHTHAGCDPSAFALSAVIPCFNPHTHAGCDFQRWRQEKPKYCFNPHTHAGCDFLSLPQPCNQQCFNPHTHAGCDDANGEFLDTLKVSIHTPTQGVTLSDDVREIKEQFQSTHPRRV